MTLEGRLALLKRYFLNRTDCLAVLMPWHKPAPALVASEAELDSLLRGHLLGDRGQFIPVRYSLKSGVGAAKILCTRVGAYAPGTDGTTRWLCLDFDGAGHSSALADPLGTALEAQRVLAGLGLPSYLERSGGGQGYHAWCFFDPPAPAAEVRALGHACAPKQARLVSGRLAKPESGQGIEVFPKQPRTSQDGYGNLVWLPFWAKAANGGGLFYRTTAGSDLEPLEVTAFETISEEAFLKALAALEPKPAQAPATTRPAPKAAPLPRPASAPGSGDLRWRAWRKAALAALPLEAIYGEWLTGKRSGEAWLECRDPASASGDQHPSAGVADGTGEAARGTFHSFISGESLSVFDFLLRQGRAADFRAACARVAELAGVPLPQLELPSAEELQAWANDFLDGKQEPAALEPAALEPAAPAKGEPPARPRLLPSITCNRRQLRDVAADAWKALHAANDPPRLFLRAGMLNRLVDRGLGPVIDPMNEDAVVGALARVANWQKVTDRGMEDCSPSKDAARDLASMPDPRLPRLRDVVFSPIFDQDGRLVLEPGYQPKAELWLHLHEGFSVPPVPAQPTAQDVRTAREFLLGEVLVDFPFVGEADRAHALAAMLCPVVRRMIDGPTPAHLYSSPTPGTGKGLAADMAGIANLGRLCEPTTLPTNEEEARKKITSLLLHAPSIILIDNVRVRLDCSPLAAALTSDIWSDRLLGFNQMADLPNRATWLITANNPELSMELARRNVRVRMDAHLERPWTRTGFRHPRLRRWARENRGQLVHALLVLVQAWVVAGKRPGQASLGSFEAWAELVGGILEHAEVPGFLGNLDEFMEEVDDEALEWRAFVKAWAACLGTDWVPTRHLLALARDHDLLPSMLDEAHGKAGQSQLGKALRSIRGQRFGDWRIEHRLDSHANAVVYRVAPVGGKAAPEASP